MSYMLPDNVGRFAALRVRANHQTSIMASFAIDIARPGDYAISMRRSTDAVPKDCQMILLPYDFGSEFDKDLILH